MYLLCGSHLVVVRSIFRLLVVCFLMESNVERDTMRNLNKIWYSVRHLLSVYTTGALLNKSDFG